MCCGNKRNTLSGSSRPGRAGGGLTGSSSGAGATVHLEYTGSSFLTLTGSITGRKYHFPEKGAVLPVDPRDARALLGMPVLKQVVG